MSCLGCSNGALRDGTDADRDKMLRRMAARGLVNCLLSNFRATFHSTDHRCARWAPADEKTTAARIAWHDKNKAT